MTCSLPSVRKLCLRFVSCCWIVLVMSDSSFVYSQDSSPPVFGVHDIEVEDGTDAEAFERYIVQKVAPAWREPRNGMSIVVLKGDRGERKGKYQLVYSFESVATRDKFFPTEGGSASTEYQQTMSAVADIMQGLSQFEINTLSFTDYVPLGTYAPNGTTPVIAVRNIELGENVDADEFEHFVKEHLAPAFKEPLEGLQIIFTKGNRGARKGKYQFIWVFDSIETRNKYYPTEGGEGTGKFEEVISSVSDVIQGLQRFPFSSNGFTDYYPLNQRRQETTDVSRGSWEDAEWAKLTGSWKAPLENGYYRIKRIRRGHETLEIYDADGERVRVGESDMTIDRRRGINFFTVRRGTPQEYTSIYKVHNGKWYEQLRGIFANNEQIPPNAFLIYERTEE